MKKEVLCNEIPHWHCNCSDTHTYYELKMNGKIILDYIWGFVVYNSHIECGILFKQDKVLVDFDWEVKDKEQYIPNEYVKFNRSAGNRTTWWSIYVAYNDLFSWINDIIHYSDRFKCKVSHNLSQEKAKEVLSLCEFLIDFRKNNYGKENKSLSSIKTIFKVND